MGRFWLMQTGALHPLPPTEIKAEPGNRDIKQLQTGISAPIQRQKLIATPQGESFCSSRVRDQHSQRLSAYAEASSAEQEVLTMPAENGLLSGSTDQIPG